MRIIRSDLAAFGARLLILNIFPCFLRLCMLISIWHRIARLQPEHSNDKIFAIWLSWLWGVACVFYKLYNSSTRIYYTTLPTLPQQLADPPRPVQTAAHSLSFLQLATHRSWECVRVCSYKKLLDGRVQHSYGEIAPILPPIFALSKPTLSRTKMRHSKSALCYTRFSAFNLKHSATF